MNDLYRYEIRRLRDSLLRGDFPRHAYFDRVVALRTQVLHPRAQAVPIRGMTFTRSRWLFLRLIGFVYLIAFVSLAVQITGLVGEHGLLPVREFLGQIREQHGASAYYSWPTLVWLSPSDAWLTTLCWGGAVVSLLLIAGIVPAATAALLWLLYLSMTVGGPAVSRVPVGFVIARNRTSHCSVRAAGVAGAHR